MVAVEISVQWGYEIHSIVLSPGDWEVVKNGGPLNISGEGYWYEAEFFEDYWMFGGGPDGSLQVSYGDDGAVGFTGTLSGAEITEFNCEKQSDASGATE
jgi:hypothetical protein